MKTNISRIRRAVAAMPWAIQPERLETILAVLELRSQGEMAAIDAALSTRNRTTPQAPQGVAVLSMVGTIAPRMDMVDAMSGGLSADGFGRAFDRAMEDPNISAIVFDVHSPGGSVYGVDELSRKIFEARGKGKRIIAIANSLMASAAYYVASAADEVVVTPSGEVGSIGVYSVHFDYSAMLEREGVRATVLRAGEHKAELNPYEPLGEDAKAYALGQIGDYYDLFISAVARNRGVSPAAVRAEWGQGRTFTARRAVEVGLADRIATLEEVLAELGVSRSWQIHVPAGGASVSVQVSEPEDDKTMVGGGDGAPVLQANDMARDGGAPTKSPRELTALDVAKEEAVDPVMDTAAQNGAAPVAVGQDFLAAERKRAREITELAAEHGMADRAAEWIESGKSADAVGREILALKAREAKPVSVPEPKALVDMSAKEQRRYSIARAIKAAADNNWSEAGLELEVHEEIERKLKRPAKGLYVPTLLSPTDRQAANTAGGNGTGKELVFVEPGSFIDMLRSRLVAARLGATFLPGLQGDVAFPRQTSANTLAWRAENPGSDQSDSTAGFDQLVLRPKEAQATTAFSRKLLAQNVVNIEQIIRADLAAIAARGVDRAALHGSGTNNEPTGIYSTSGVNSVAFGGPISYVKVVEMETEIAADDADIGVMAYATTPRVRGLAKTTQVFADTNGVPLWTGGVEDGEMNGYRAIASTQIRSDLGGSNDEHGIIFGVWSELYIGEWGAMELIVDPYSKKKQALIEVTMHLMADIGLRHPAAFCVGTGLTLTAQGG